MGLHRRHFPQNWRRGFHGAGYSAHDRNTFATRGREQGYARAVIEPRYGGSARAALCPRGLPCGEEGSSHPLGIVPAMPRQVNFQIIQNPCPCWFLATHSGVEFGTLSTDGGTHGREILTHKGSGPHPGHPPEIPVALGTAGCRATADYYTQPAHQGLVGQWRQRVEITGRTRLSSRNSGKIALTDSLSVHIRLD